jgi:hypothetical protein
MMLGVALCQNPRGDVLVVKFQAIVGVGKVYRSERMVQWRAHGYKDVSAVINLLRPFLNEVKLMQAQLAGERYLAYQLSHKKTP